MLGPLKRAYYTYACTHTHTHARGRKRDGSGNDFPVAFSFRFVLKGKGRKIETPRYHRGIYTQVCSKPTFDWGDILHVFFSLFLLPSSPFLKPEIKRISSGIAAQVKGEQANETDVLLLFAQKGIV